ncbi:MAG: TIGR03619 family F420-dependent LLM class oxidoreductase [Acidimicrobiia bacterium]
MTSFRVSLSAYDRSPAELLELAQAAESSGFHGLWLGEHALHVPGYASSHPQHAGGTAIERPVVTEATRLPDQWVMIGAIAASTTRLHLGTAVHLLALRHPLHTARSVASIQILSGGRFSLGVGVGWLREEFDAFGIDFKRRGQIVEESVDVVRRVSTGDLVSHDGEFFRFGPAAIGLTAAPVSVLLGGNTERALERAARIGDGWISSGTTGIDDVVRLRRRLRELRDRAGRAVEPFEVHACVSDDAVTNVERLRDAGFADITVRSEFVWRGDSLSERSTGLADFAAAIGLDPSPAAPCRTTSTLAGSAS